MLGLWVGAREGRGRTRRSCLNFCPLGCLRAALARGALPAASARTEINGWQSFRAAVLSSGERVCSLRSSPDLWRGGGGQNGPPGPLIWLLFSHQTSSHLPRYQHVLAKPELGFTAVDDALGRWDAHAPAARLPWGEDQTALPRAVTQPRPICAPEPPQAIPRPRPADKDLQLKPTRRFSQTCSK